MQQILDNDNIVMVWMHPSPDPSCKYLRSQHCPLSHHTVSMLELR